MAILSAANAAGVPLVLDAPSELLIGALRKTALGRCLQIAEGDDDAA